MFYPLALAAAVLIQAGVPSPSEPRIDTLMSTLHQRGQFDGSIIVSHSGRIVYRNAFGDANVATHQRFQPTTIACIASVSKQFTAMAIMMLAERGALGLDDPVSKFVPEVGRYTREATLRHLLNHTSGIPDVGDLGIDNPGLTNEHVLRALTKQTTLASTPGTTYRYSNTGYVLLAVVVERVTHKRFGAFLTERIFAPVGMKSTSVVDETTHAPRAAAMAYNQFGKPDDCTGLTTGDGGVFSTVDDLRRWDQALYGESLVRQKTLAMALEPPALTSVASTYGFGWNVRDEAGQKVMWHTGSNGGHRAYIERRPNERSSIIMLTNRGNTNRIAIAAAIVNILHGKPFEMPRRSIAEALYATRAERGMGAALQLYDSLRSVASSDYDFRESELNTLGYELLGERVTNDAVSIFELNTKSYPASSNAFDSLAEANAHSGDTTRALANYRRALQLDASNLHATSALKALLAHAP